MTTRLENPAMSMILTVPKVDVLVQSSASPISIPIIENLECSDIDQSLNNNMKSSMPLYHGSIIRLERYNNDQNTSNLIIRVPNFQHPSSPSSDKCSTQRTRIKRRAPLCPLLIDSKQQLNNSLSDTHVINEANHFNQNQSQVTGRNFLTSGLRSISRVFTYGCKPKESSSSNDITLPLALPDVEVIVEKVGKPTTSKNNTKAEHSPSTTPKLLTPKILFIKQKYLSPKPKLASSTMFLDIKTNAQNNQGNRASLSTILTTQYSDVQKSDSRKTTAFLLPFIKHDNLDQEKCHAQDDDDDNDTEQQDKSIKLQYEVEQHLAAISELVSDIPISPVDTNSLSTHRYSTISANVLNNRASILDNLSLSEQPSPIICPVSIQVPDELNSNETKPIINKISPKKSRGFRIQTSLLQPDISVIRVGTTDLITGSDCILPGEKLSNEHIDKTSNIQFDIEQMENVDYQRKEHHYGHVDPLDDNFFTECYEIVYQMDSQNHKEKEQKTDQSLICSEINPQSFTCNSISSTIPTWFPSNSANNYERIEYDSNAHDTNRKNAQFEKRIYSVEDLETFQNENSKLINKSSCTNFHSDKNLSATSNDQTSMYPSESISDSSLSSDISSRHSTLNRPNSLNSFDIYVDTDMATDRKQSIHQFEPRSPIYQSGLEENDQVLYTNSTPIIDEDYTVILQIVKHDLYTDTLNLDVIANGAYEEFRSKINELSQ